MMREDLGTVSLDTKCPPNRAIQDCPGPIRTETVHCCRASLSIRIANFI